MSTLVFGHSAGSRYWLGPYSSFHPVRITENATLGAVDRTIGPRCSCIRVHSVMSPSPSGSWWRAIHTGPSSADIRVTRSRTQASPRPSAMSVQEYGSLKLIQGTRRCARSLLAAFTAEPTEPAPQYVRRTPRG